MAADPSAMAALRSHRAVVYSVVAAAVAVAACAIVAIAWMLGWLPGPPSPAAGSNASPARQASADALDPGESIVSAPDGAKRPEPLMPTYSRPVPPPPAPAADPQPAPLPRSEGPAAPIPAEPRRTGERERYMNPDPSRPGPEIPSFAFGGDRHAQAPSGPQADPRRPGAACLECGTVSSIASRYPGLWDVRVRLEDGASQTFRFRGVPPFHIGDRIRVDGAHLVHD